MPSLSFRQKLGSYLNGCPALKTAAKAAYYFARDQFGRGQILEVGGRSLRVPARFAEQPWTFYEPAATRSVADWLDAHPGATLLDVGSSVGLYSLLALASSTKSTAWAFDADMVSLQATRWLVRHYGDKRLNVVHGLITAQASSALSSEQARAVTMKRLSSEKIPREPSSADYLCLDGSDRPDIPLYSLDSLFQAPHQPAPLVIKIDVEGAELLVLQGADRLVRAVSPALMVSVHPGALSGFGHHRDHIETWLRTRGYTPEITIMPHEEHWWCPSPPTRGNPA